MHRNYLPLTLISILVFNCSCSSYRTKAPTARGDGWGDTNQVLREVENNPSLTAFEMMSKRVWRDSRYLLDAQLALALNSDLVGHQVEAFVKDGVIYLKGQARTPAQRTLAARIVSLGRGPFLVRNQIQIAD